MKTKWVVLLLLPCIFGALFLFSIFATALYVSGEGTAIAALGAFSAEEHWNMDFTWQHVWLHYSLWAQTYWLYVACVCLFLFLIVALVMYGNRISWDFLRRRGSTPEDDDYKDDHLSARA